MSNGFKPYKVVCKNGNEKWFASKKSAKSFLQKNGVGTIYKYSPFQSGPISTV